MATYRVARVLLRQGDGDAGALRQEAQGRTMSPEAPWSLLERQVNEVVGRGFGTLPTTVNITCVCGHPAMWHDGFGCAAAEAMPWGRCGCENFVENKPKGTVGDAD